jgi:hypothetical protein
MFDEKELLKKTITKTTPLKEYIVNYVGNKLESFASDPSEEDWGITIEMIIQVFTEDFPEIVLALAEENFIRGYEQGLNDQLIVPPEEITECL